jgi:hypothetical protein
VLWHIKLSVILSAGSANEAGTGVDDVAAGSPQHALYHQEAHCVQDEPECWCIDGIGIALPHNQSVLLMASAPEVLVTK